MTGPPDPQNQGSVGDDIVFDFQEDSTANSYNFYETQRQVYQGSSSGGTLLLTLLTCYNNNFTSCSAPSAGVSSPIAQVDAYQVLPIGSTTKTALSETHYSSSLPTGDNEYDYGVNTGSAPSSTYMVRATTIQYANLSSIGNRPSLITVTDGQGHTMARTTYTYDEGSVTPTSNTPQHVAVTGSRGNATTVSRWVSGSLLNGPSLTQHFTYYDTGNVNTDTDVNGAVTTNKGYVCGNAFPIWDNDIHLRHQHCRGPLPARATEAESDRISDCHHDIRVRLTSSSNKCQLGIDLLREPTQSVVGIAARGQSRLSHNKIRPTAS